MANACTSRPPGKDSLLYIRRLIVRMEELPSSIPVAKLDVQSLHKSHYIKFQISIGLAEKRVIELMFCLGTLHKHLQHENGRC